MGVADFYSDVDLYAAVKDGAAHEISGVRNHRRGRRLATFVEGVFSANFDLRGFCEVVPSVKHA